MDWNDDMKSAPRDGTAILVQYNIADRMVPGGGILEKADPALWRPGVAVFSTWDGCFRITPGGAELNGLHHFQPRAWAAIPEIK